MYLCKHESKSSALLLLFLLFFFYGEFSKHDVFFNKLFLAGLVVLGLQWKSQALVERERGREKVRKRSQR